MSRVFRSAERTRQLTSLNRIPWRPTNMKKPIVLLTLMFFVCGCTVGPDYKRPKVDVPGAYRGAPEETAPSQQSSSQQAPQPADRASPQGLQPANNPPQPSALPEQSFGDQKWWEVFEDPQLQDLIRTALKQNYDVRIAATRIVQAQAQLGITRADQLPTIGFGASTVNERVPKEKPVNQAFETNATSVGASFAWELDFWGKYRRATEATRANLLATEWARRA